MKLKDKVVLLTGGGRGIGSAMAYAFAREGAKLVLAARTVQECESVVEKIKASGGIAVAERCDVSVIEEVDELIRDTLEEFKRIDVLVNNAGVYGPIGLLFENDLSEWRNTIQINLLGTVICTYKVIPQMIKNRCGSIINLSGGGAVSPFPHFTAYSTSKAAVVRFTETLAEEMKEFGIRVNAISPGAVNTQLLDEAIAAGERCGKEFLKRCLEQKEKGGIPPEKAAELAVFLASEESLGVTGKVISVVWDDWKTFPARLEEIQQTSLYTLRRIDGRNFTEIRAEVKTET